MRCSGEPLTCLLARVHQLGRGHDQRIFTVVFVVPRPASRFDETEACIEALCVEIGDPHVERRDPSLAVSRLAEQLEYQRRMAGEMLKIAAGIDAALALHRAHALRADDITHVEVAGFGWLMGLSHGGIALMATLGASASYIAAPATMRMAVPEANPPSPLVRSHSLREVTSSR